MTSYCYVYNPMTDIWTISDISIPQLTLPVAVIEKKIYLTGGMNKNGEYNRNLYEITYGGMKDI